MQTQYYGVDLTNYQCHKLQPDPLFQNYKKEDLHFPIASLQKGQKPFSQKSIKRIKKRNWKKKKLIQNDKEYVKPLIPKSPQQICMKGLRRQFRVKLQESYIEAQNTQVKQKTTPQIKRKLYQKYRRHELYELIKNNKFTLKKIFGRRMNPVGGKSKLPRISRAQIKEVLKNYVQPKSVNDQFQKDQEGLKRRRVRSRSVQSSSSSSSQSSRSQMIQEQNTPEVSQ